jgi:ribonuclease D
VENLAYTLHQGDLAEGVVVTGSVAVDTEAMGLNNARDRLCLVQLCGEDGHIHLVQIAPGPVHAPRLAALLADPTRQKIMHYARFDVALLQRSLNIIIAPIFCTKIASRLCRTYTDRHGLKELCRELLGIDISKQQQSSDWGAASLSNEQLAYAASDVLYLHRIRDILQTMLIREGRMEAAQACFDFLPTRVALDRMGWQDEDIFAH